MIEANQLRDVRLDGAAVFIQVQVIVTGPEGLLDILRDQLYFLNRCGFNAFELREDQDLEAALAAFTDYAWQPNSHLYQEATP